MTLQPNDHNTAWKWWKGSNWIVPADTRTPSALTAKLLMIALWPDKFCKKTPSGNFHCLMLSGDPDANEYLDGKQKMMVNKCFKFIHWTNNSWNTNGSMSLFQTLFETHTGENLFSILSFIYLFLSLPQPVKNKQTFTDFNFEFATAISKKHWTVSGKPANENAIMIRIHLEPKTVNEMNNLT